MMKVLMILCAIIAIVGGFFIGVLGNRLDTSQVFAEDMSIDKGVLQLHGSISNSSKRYIKHEIISKEDALYILVYGKYISPFDKPETARSGEFTVESAISPDTNFIYFKGKYRNDLKLIWSKQNTNDVRSGTM